jgi:hypothetical protein
MHMFDIFSKPFYFSVKKGEEKNKTLGGLLTLSILIIPLVYFISILITFFNRENPLSIS